MFKVHKQTLPSRIHRYPSCLGRGASPRIAETQPPVIFSERDWNGEGLVHFAVLYSSDNPAAVVC